MSSKQKPKHTTTAKTDDGHSVSPTTTCHNPAAAAAIQREEDDTDKPQLDFFITDAVAANGIDRKANAAAAAALVPQDDRDKEQSQTLVALPHFSRTDPRSAAAATATTAAAAAEEEEEELTRAADAFAEVDVFFDEEELGEPYEEGATDHGTGFSRPSSPGLAQSTTRAIHERVVGRPRPPFRFSWRKLWAFMGPGWLMSIAYLDPGNLESDLQAGAYAGYSLLWVLLWSTVAGFVLQILAARLGVVTQRDLAQHCRREYSRPVSLLLWLCTEAAIIGSDIQEVVGSAIAFNIIFGFELWIGSLLTALDTFTFLLLHYFGIRKLEAFFVTLVGTMLVCFFVDFGVVKPDGLAILKGTVVPNMRSYAVMQAVGLVGAVIMPHNIYLHSSLVKSRRVDRKDRRKVWDAIRYFEIEAAVALFVSFCINLAVVSVFAKGFFNPDCAELGKASLGGVCNEIGLLEAGDALHGLLGRNAAKVWAVGLLAAGQSSTMTGTFAGQFVMEGFMKWKIPQWQRVGITRSIALVPALLVSLYSGSNSKDGDNLDEWLNILQSVQLPFALIPVLQMTSNVRIMGEYATGHILRGICWFLALGVFAINVFMIYNFTTDPTSPTPYTWWFGGLVIVIAALYTTFLANLIRLDVRDAWRWCMRRIFDTPEQLRRYDRIGSM